MQRCVNHLFSSDPSTTFSLPLLSCRLPLIFDLIVFILARVIQVELGLTGGQEWEDCDEDAPLVGQSSSTTAYSLKRILRPIKKKRKKDYSDGRLRMMLGMKSTVKASSLNSV